MSKTIRPKFCPYCGLDKIKFLFGMFHRGRSYYRCGNCDLVFSLIPPRKLKRNQANEPRKRESSKEAKER